MAAVEKTFPVPVNPVSAATKAEIARSFGAAAGTYDDLAGLQKDIGKQLIAMIEPNVEVNNIVDVGCGTGWLTNLLSTRFNLSDVIGIDLSVGMLDYASAKYPQAAIGWCVADMEQLPLAASSQELVYSNLAMQWLADSRCWFEEAFRVLQPGGILQCSTLLPGTLFELERAWQYADKQAGGFGNVRHVNSFATAEKLVHAYSSAGFVGSLKQQTVTRFYPSVKHIMAELKGIGAHNITPQRPAAMTGKQRLRWMLEGYDAFRTTEGFPTTYQVALLKLRKPKEKAFG